MKVHTQDGVVKYVSTDNEGEDEFNTRQARACIRGRSSRYKVYNANRLKRPLKRGVKEKKVNLCLFLGNKLSMKSLQK
ncbi:hypothetical protein ACD574_05085 [Campylobacter sp. LH-2024]|uniref:hypothetical protein n=1 Tax=Campylobacter sp. LH-2024 TaxID=3239825 RepID=UPI003B7871DD